jgi:hypothetical protein
VEASEWWKEFLGNADTAVALDLVGVSAFPDPHLLNYLSHLHDSQLWFAHDPITLFHEAVIGMARVTLDADDEIFVARGSRLTIFIASIDYEWSFADVTEDPEGIRVIQSCDRAFSVTLRTDAFDVVIG